MNNDYRIGIDIGGTNTDAVLVHSTGTIVAWNKSSTTPDVALGVKVSIEQLLLKSGIPPQQIHSICLGTTQATNALLERKELYRVGVLRLAGHNPEVYPSCQGWPQQMRHAVHAATETVGGGFDCDSSAISPVDASQVRQSVEKLLERGAESLAIVGVFSPLNGEQELYAADLCQMYDIPISLSHEIGGIGFIERENSTILNAALKKVMAKGFATIKSALEVLLLRCPLWITQNNGSLITLAKAIEYPVMTISAGPTNSFIGGAKLSGMHDAIIVDIGGTSTDIGILHNGFPRRSLRSSHIGGIPLNFSMPDVLSIAIGGGSHICRDTPLKIGPDSCGHRTFSEGLCFGGNQLTLTDAALGAGRLKIPGASPSPLMPDREGCEAILTYAEKQIDSAIAKARGPNSQLTVILIGGGASLLKVAGQNELSPFAAVANAYGAAFAEICASVDAVISLKERKDSLEALQQRAIAAAEALGAYEPRIVDLQIIPYHYLPQQIARVLVTASGAQKSLR